ncbi:MAG: hypothetical protein Q9227_002237 [Pyrenula ochraceoflavens]
MSINNVALIGASGHLGPFILNALLSAQPSFHRITVFARISSTSTYPSTVNVVRHSSDPSISELVPLLKSQDALIVSFAGGNVDLQIRLADAAAQAGVKRFIPADFGSCDSESARAREYVDLYNKKKEVRDHLVRLCGSPEGNGMSWTSLVCGHFFDYGITSGLLGFEIGEKKARLYDGGRIKFSASTRARIGEAVVQVLRHEDVTKNRMLYTQSFSATQREILGVLETITGGKWETEEVGSKDFMEKKRKEAEAATGEEKAEAIEELVSVLGIVEANWEGNEAFANKMLGLDEENLEEVIRKAIQSK